MKRCYKCGETKSEENFRPHSRTKDRLNHCRACENKATRGRIKVRRELLMAYKQTIGCTDCGYNDNPACLEFDHLPHFDKAFTIGTGVTQKGLDALAKEIAKCEVVCANCHRIRTLRREDEKRTDDLSRLRERWGESVEDLVCRVQDWKSKHNNPK